MGHFHDRIVVASEDHDGRIRSVTLELGVDKHDQKKIIPRCEDFKGNVQQLKCKKNNVVCPFKHLADQAMTVLIPMQSEPYDLFERNCQIFCNGVLKKVGAETYVTTPEAIAGVMGFGFLRIAVGVWAYLGPTKRKTKEKNR